MQVNVSIEMYHNSIANLQNATLGLVFMRNSSTANMNAVNMSLPLTGLNALVVTHSAEAIIGPGSYIGLLLTGREDPKATYSATITGSIVVIGYVIGYAKVKFITTTIGFYVECAGGADTNKYAVELENCPFVQQVNARSWAPLA